MAPSCLIRSQRQNAGRSAVAHGAACVCVSGASVRGRPRTGVPSGPTTPWGCRDHLESEPDVLRELFLRCDLLVSDNASDEQTEAVTSVVSVALGGHSAGPTTGGGQGSSRTDDRRRTSRRGGCVRQLLVDDPRSRGGSGGVRRPLLRARLRLDGTCLMGHVPPGVDSSTPIGSIERELTGRCGAGTLFRCVGMNRSA